METQPITLILTTYTIVILVVVVMVIGILIGARASQQRREIGLARAVGLTPRQVSAMFTIETATLGIVGVLLGSVVGVFAAPTLAAPLFTTLLGSPAAAADPRNLAIAALPILFVLIAGSWLSTRRWTRLSVVEAIRAGTARPGKRSRLARLADRTNASLAVMLGLKDLLAVRERVRDFGVLRTVGFTPHQVSSSLVGAHAVVAVLTSLVSIPLGVPLYVGVYGLGGGDGNDLVIASWWWLALVPVVAAAMVIAATGLPARISARTPITDALRYE